MYPLSLSPKSVECAACLRYLQIRTRRGMREKLFPFIEPLGMNECYSPGSPAWRKYFRERMHTT